MTIGRRELLIGGMAIAALLAMPNLAMAQPAATGASASSVRSVLTQASRTAFADLSKPDGFWSSTVARIGVPTLFAGRAAGRAQGQGQGQGQGQPVAREELQHRLNTIAQHVLPRVSQSVDRGIARLGTARPIAPLGSEPTAATTLLRRSMGPRLVNAMIPVLAKALREHNDPVIRQAMLGLKGVSTNDVAHALANEADNAIWYAIGAGEVAARREAANLPA